VPDTERGPSSVVTLPVTGQAAVTGVQVEVRSPVFQDEHAASFMQELAFSGVAFPILNSSESGIVTYVRSASSYPSHSQG